MNITIPEKLPVGSYIMTILATSSYSQIVNYQMISTSGDYFTLNTKTGKGTVKYVQFNKRRK